MHLASVERVGLCGGFQGLGNGYHNDDDVIN